MPIARTCWCLRCRVAACRSRMKWPARLAPRSMSLSCASWVSRATRSWQWGRSQPAAYAFLNDQIVQQLGLPEYVIDAVAAREQQELARRESVYRGGRRPADVRGWTVILVDDGLATGATMRAAVVALRQLQPARIVIAIPTASPETCEELKAEVDDIVCAITPEPFLAVGHWYEDFSQTTDREVRDLLARRQGPEEA
jgi:predicted phosphoribosyltransferase